MTLSVFEVCGEDTPTAWVWVLHGFMGRAQNWQGFARRLCERRPSLGCLLIDLRMHGDSQGLTPPHTIEACVEDLRRLQLTRGAPDVMIGHSFGARVAMRYAREAPPPRQVWLVDAAPASPGPRDETATGRVLAALEALPATFSDRRDFIGQLEDGGTSSGIAVWLAKNLERAPADGDSPAVLRFGLDRAALRALLEDHDRTDCWETVDAPPEGVELRFVLAGHDSVVGAEDRDRLEALALRAMVQVEHLPEAGHWVHVDDPEGLLELLDAGLPRGGGT